MNFLRIISTLSLLYVLINCILSFKLNVPRILLPIFEDIESKFVLEDVEGGCFKWTTTRDDLIKLDPIDVNNGLDCSQKILVTTVMKQRQKSKSIIIAEDVINDGITLKCDVIVDIIHNLTITTTTKELYIDDVPEMFQVNAYDHQGNEFSTLEGIEFDWTITSKSSKKQSSSTSNSGVVVKYLPFKESPYEAPSGIDELENQNKKGSIILLQGLESGVATIGVKMHYPEYQHIPDVEVQLIVMANIMLSPHDAYVIVGDVIQFTIFIIQNGKLNRINLKDYKYYLKADNDNVIKINNAKSEVTALKIGYSKVYLTNVDDDINNNDLIKLPSSNIYVVEPSFMVLNILPNKNWAILVGDQYDIVTELYTDNKEKIQIGSSTRINMAINDSFHIEQKSLNGSWITGWGLRQDKVLIQASLKFNNDIVRATAELLIYPRISVIPSEVVLPWDPITKPKYPVNLSAKGGDGRFLWSSTNTTLGLVTNNGQVHTLKDGEFEIVVSMLRNHYNRQSSKFTITKPTRLEISEYIMEAAINEPIYLHLMLYGEKYSKKDDKNITVPFTQCQDLQYQIKFSDNRFYVNRTDKLANVGMSCGNLAIIGRHVGQCKVTVIYQIEDLILEDSVVINTYNPLKLTQPEQEIVLSIGSSINLLYEGGPKPLIGRNTQHERIIKIIPNNDNTGTDMIEFKDVSNNYQLSDDNTVIWVLCRKLGEINLQLEIRNLPIATNCKTRPAVLQTLVLCGKPRHIRLQPDLKQINTGLCPIDRNSDSFIIPINTNLTLNVDIYDDQGRLFKNASTFIINWSSSPYPIKFYNLNGVFTKHLLIGDQLRIANGSQQIIQVESQVGQSISISTKLSTYDKKKLKKLRVTSEWPEFIDKNDNNQVTPNIETNVNLLLMNNTKINREKFIIFNQPNVRRTIDIIDGSGYIQLKLLQDDLAVVEYNQQNRQIEILPLKAGELLVEINDLCLIAEPIMVQIHILTISNMKIEMLDKTEINRCIECIVKLYDKQDNLLEFDDLETINLKYRLTKPLVNIDLNPVQLKTNQLSYLITGIEIGYTDLQFIYEDSEHDVTSQTIQLQVFEPLRVYPRNTTILIGSIQQLTIKGGPYPESNLEFQSTNNNIEIENKNGLIIGKQLGRTQIIIRSTDINPYNGERIIYCDDMVEVNVVKLNGIRISSPLTTLRIGTTIPVWISGIPQEISPMILGSFERNRINFNWYLQQNGVAVINDIFIPLGIVYTNQDRISLRLTGINVGIARLSVNVTIDEQQFTTYHDFEIIDNFKLIQPSNLIENSILMAPHSRLQIETNFDETHVINYSLSTNEGCDQSKQTQLIFNKAVFDNVIEITDDGLLQSTGRLGFGLLIVTATDEQGWKRSLTYVVQVKPIHYMMMTIQANWRLHFNSHLNVIPIGTEINIIPNFYDNLGNEFNTVPVNVEIRGNRHDLLTLNYYKFNNTIKTNIKHSGITMIKTWTSGETNTADYIRLHSEDIMTPVTTYMVSGDLLCLWSPIVSRDLQLEKWNSSNLQLLLIDHNSNIAIANYNDGEENNVYLTNPLHPSLPIFLQILPVATIELLPQSELILTNGPIGTNYIIPLVLKSDQCPDNKDTNLIQGWRCDLNLPQAKIQVPFDCFMSFTNTSIGIEASDVFALENGIKLETGQYHCKISIQEYNYVSHLATVNTNLTVWASTKDESRLESEHIVIPFQPNVDVPKEIRISVDDTIGVLDIIGLEHILKQIHVEPVDGSIIYVDSGTFVSTNLLRYRVQVIDYHWKFAYLDQTMGIRVQSPNTNQNTVVIVVVEDGYMSGSCRNTWLSHFLYTYRHSVVILLSVAFIFFLTCYVYSRYMQPIVNVNVGPRRSLLQSGRGNTSVTPTTIPRLTSCNPCNTLRSTTPVQNLSSGPVYGDNSFSITSPELRRNRRFL